jgi:squalene synthase HpnC
MSRGVERRFRSRIVRGGLTRAVGQICSALVIDPRTPILDLLATLGPGAAPSVSRDEAWRYVRGLASSHYENFSVLSSLVPERLRDDFASVYAFCRWADDLGDETGSDDAARARSLELLEWWRSELHAAYAGSPRHPVFIALRETIDRHHLPDRPFSDLIDAFVQDQKVRAYATWAQVLDYCTRSANPVGRIVLMMAGHRPETDDRHRFAMSDATCTALQLINFWQDVRRDLVERDRVYLPALDTGITPEMLRAWMTPEAGRTPDVRLRYIRAVRPLVERTRLLFDEGAPLPGLVAPEIRPVIWLFGAGGRAVLSRVEAIGCTTLWQRPRLSKFTKASLVARAWLMVHTGGFAGRSAGDSGRVALAGAQGGHR